MHRYLRSLGFAFQGLHTAVRTERNLRLFIALYVLSLGISWLLDVSARDWEVVIAGGAVFLAMELMNTAIERFTDAFDKHSSSIHTAAIKATKDIAASASLVCALGWIGTLVIIFWPHLWTFGM